jgi:hypothetical protein
MIGMKSGELLLILKSFLQIKNNKKPKQNPSIAKLNTNHFIIKSFYIKIQSPHAKPVEIPPKTA